MILDRVECRAGRWRLLGPVGEELLLPANSRNAFEFATIGTGFDRLITRDRTARFADALADVGRAICLIDVRRNGSGGSGSWGPRELATIVRERLRGRGIAYGYHHVPALAPSVELLGAFSKARGLIFPSDRQQERGASPRARFPEREIQEAIERICFGDDDLPEVAWHRWQIFRARFLREQSDAGVLAGRAFVEGVHASNALAVFLCTEGRVANFDALGQDECDDAYCHRFTVAAEIARCLRIGLADVAGHGPDLEIRRIDLEPGHEPVQTMI